MDQDIKPVNSAAYETLLANNMDLEERLAKSVERCAEKEKAIEAYGRHSAQLVEGRNVERARADKAEAALASMTGRAERSEAIIADIGRLHRVDLAEVEAKLNAAIAERNALEKGLGDSDQEMETLRTERDEAQGKLGDAQADIALMKESGDYDGWRDRALGAEIALDEARAFWASHSSGTGEPVPPWEAE